MNSWVNIHTRKKNRAQEVLYPSISEYVVGGIAVRQSVILPLFPLNRQVNK